MRKKLFTAFMSLLIAVPLVSQETMEKVPKQYSFQAGFVNSTDRGLENTTLNGGHVLFDYAWQLSGFHKKSAAYISVPLGYTWLSGSGSQSLGILSYGWTVRHELARDKKYIPFLGYGLLLNQLRQQGTDGSIFGHQTQFTLGVDMKSGKRITPYINVEYSLVRFPRFGSDQSIRFNQFAVKAGVRFGRKR